jgi:hypothetical protein
MLTHDSRPSPHSQLSRDPTEPENTLTPKADEQWDKGLKAWCNVIGGYALLRALLQQTFSKHY